MGEVVAFCRPIVSEPADGGTIHIWMHQEDHLEIGHESRNGDSWGSFETFASAADAVAGAHRLNRFQYDGRAAVFVPDAVLALLSDSEGGAA